MASKTKNWNCTRCTFEQSVLNDKCEICGEQNKEKSAVLKDISKDSNPRASNQYGTVIYQTEKYSNNQLKSTYSIYIKNPIISKSSWPLYLFGDNDIDKSRLENTDRDMMGGQAKITGKYDRCISYGIITTFYAYKPMPNYTKFRDIINNQFNELWNKYILFGHNLIVPSPNNNDLSKRFNSFYENINNNDDNPLFQQVIFHNIGTGIAKLPLIYLKYIQYKLDNIIKVSYQHNNNKSLIINNNINIIKKKVDVKDDVKDDDDDDKKIDFSPNDPIEICVNPDLDIWLNGVFLGYSNIKLKDRCFCEVLKQNEDNHFTEIKVEFIRFKTENKNNKNNNNDNLPKVPSPMIKTRSVHNDEWENVDDFVLSEYIHDVFDEISSDLLNSLDEFMRRMEFLGVYSASSRSRALNILEDMKKDKENKESLALVRKLAKEQENEHKNNNNASTAANDEFIASEIAQKIADGHVLEIFSCIRCQQKQEYGGIDLRACSHRICYKCFPQIVSNHIAMNMVPTCIKCGSNIHETDIKIHINQHTADIVGDMSFKDMMSKQKDLNKCFDKLCSGACIIEDKWMKEWKCPVCSQRNCIKCKKIHKGNEQCYVPPPPRLVQPRYNKHNKYNNQLTNNGNYIFSVSEFYESWVNIQDIKYSNMISKFDVPYQSDEWNKVIQHIRDPNKRSIERIERIQHAKCWRSFWNYCESNPRSRSKSKWNKSNNIKVGAFWHGTRTCTPDKIWKVNGFDFTKARIGKCLWYATENTYSMNGFQHVRPDGKHQVFLALVATGNTNHCKFIRSNKILNVYKNEATYPAYLLTYKNR